MSAYPFKTRFIETQRGQCMFFLPGETGTEGFVCGAPTTDNKSFCGGCRKVTHQKPKPFRLNREVRSRDANEWALSEREPI
jgi:hypothetical protein